MQDYVLQLDKDFLIPTLKYDSTGQRHEVDPTSVKIKPASVEFLTMYTQNIWFEDHNQEERFENLLKMIEESNADFICLQEVTQEFQLQLSTNSTIVSRYFVSGNIIKNYGCLILSRWPFLCYEFIYKSSTMGRSLLVAELQLNQKSFFVSTTHLESLGKL